MYEMIFASYRKHEASFGRADAIAAILQAAGEDGLTCKEIGKILYGDDYNNHDKDWRNARHPAQISAVLKALRKQGYATCEKKPTDPVEVTYTKYVVVDNSGEPEILDVVDARGNHYEMRNPRFNPCTQRGEYQEVVESITPTVRVWKWVNK